MSTTVFPSGLVIGPWRVYLDAYPRRNSSARRWHVGAVREQPGNRVAGLEVCGPRRCVALYGLSR